MKIKVESTKENKKEKEYSWDELTDGIYKPAFIHGVKIIVVGKGRFYSTNKEFEIANPSAWNMDKFTKLQEKITVTFDGVE